jgi:hypothetical protein
MRPALIALLYAMPVAPQLSAKADIPGALTGHFSQLPLDTGSALFNLASAIFKFPLFARKGIKIVRS